MQVDCENYWAWTYTQVDCEYWAWTYMQVDCENYWAWTYTQVDCENDWISAGIHTGGLWEQADLNTQVDCENDWAWTYTQVDCENDWISAGIHRWTVRTNGPEHTGGLWERLDLKTHAGGLLVICLFQFFIYSMRNIWLILAGCGYSSATFSHQCVHYFHVSRQSMAASVQDF